MTKVVPFNQSGFEKPGEGPGWHFFHPSCLSTVAGRICRDKALIDGVQTDGIDVRVQMPAAGCALFTCVKAV